MYISVVTLFPQLFNAVTDYGVTGRAIKKELIKLDFWNPRDYALDRHRRVDDRPYGGGPGMVMMVEPLRATIREAKQKLEKSVNQSVKVIHLSPQGNPISQADLQSFAANQALVLVASRYEGVDERLIKHEVDEEYSIGDYVISGGDIAALVVIDGIARLIPGALGDDESAIQDSFVNGLLDYPHYTRPEIVDGEVVPQILLSGDHKAIARWRLKQSLGRTWLRRPDLLEKMNLDQIQIKLLNEFIDDYKQNLESDNNATHKRNGASHE